MTKKLYLHESAPLQGEARIIQIDISGAQPIIRLDQTWLHPKGGGQLPDKGRIGGANVVDVRHAGQGDVDHVVDSVDGLHVDDVVTISVDAEHRRMNARLHNAGHLIAGVMETPFKQFVPIGAHHYPGECRVEFRGPADSLERLRSELPGLLREAISRDLPVNVCGDPEVNRTIQIGDFRPISCGGTHPASLSPLVRIEITNIKAKDGKIRVSYSL